MGNANEDWYRIHHVEDLDSPALVIYPERVKENIRVLLSMVDDPLRLRPHVKTHKCKEATQLLMQSGINKFKCATIAEAEMLGICGAADILLAYQPSGPKQMRLLLLVRKFPASKFSCVVDNLKPAREISELFASQGLKIPVYIDLNLGQNRTGINVGKDALELYEQCSLLHGMEPIGLHGYDGHIRDIDFNARKQKCDEAFAKIENMQRELLSRGFNDPIIVAGGSPTFSIHSKRKKIECSPGTFIYWDRGYTILCPEQDFKPAALVISRVISLPSPTTLCLDLGHKSIAAENELTNRVYFINGPQLKAVSQSEEHLVVEAGPDHHHQIGDLFYGIPVHVCPTIALYERAYTVENGRINGEWKTIARDRKIVI
jgi:D-serine deaminase-like pyridoxal phosphate-dependent protein